MRTQYVAGMMLATALLTGPALARSTQVAQVTPAARTDAKPSETLPGSVDKTAVNAATFVARDLAAEKTANPFLVKAQILLDRNNASPGVIDGREGGNMDKAIAVFENLRGLPADPKLTPDAWTALHDDPQRPPLVDYTITGEDLVGPFYPDLPSDYAELAKLKHAGYRDPIEMFAERFHMDQGLIKALNPKADFGKVGTVIVVADVTRPAISGKIARIDVDKDKGQVRAFAADNKLVVAYPATVGSEELPSPSGTYKVKGVAWAPVYSYDPKKNFQQGKNRQKLTLPSGPNNPVGVVFIALTKPTYGLHGTPDPSKIDKSASHGCVRLTNWDALELAHLVRGGVPVAFVGAGS